MTKSELINQIVELSLVKGLDQPSGSKSTLEQGIKILIDSMIRSLAKGQRIEIRGFGSFDLNYRPERIGRNPRTGTQVAIEAKMVPHFKPGKELRQKVNQTIA